MHQHFFYLTMPMLFEAVPKGTNTFYFFTPHKMADGNSTPDEQINNDSPEPGSDGNSPQEKPADGEGGAETTVEKKPAEIEKKEEKPIDTEGKEPDEEKGDPIDDLFDGGENNKKSNLSGKNHLENAVVKKFDELSEGIQSGDPKAILEFKNLKPKIQEGVVKKLSAVTDIEGKPLENAKQILDYYEDIIPKEDTKSASNESDAANITLTLKNKFMEKAVAEGLKPEDMKAHKEAVVELARKRIAEMKEDNIPLSKFSKYFDFDAAYLMATNEIQKAKVHAEGLESGKKIEGGKKASPAANADMPKPGEQVKVDELVSQAEYFSSDDPEWRKSYREKHTKPGSDIIQFSDSTLE